MYCEYDWLIEIVKNIRSTKVNLNVSPGSFIDISITELSTDKIKIINDNLNVFKRLGRVKNVVNKNLKNDGVRIVVNGETLVLYFDQNFDIKAQKQKIANKVEKLTHEIKKITEKLKNKSFLRNAPKQIVSREKNALINNKNELKKLNSILNSIKN